MSDTATAEPKGEIVLLPPITALELFENGGVRSILDQIKTEAKSRVTDATTEAGRKEIKSLAYKIAQTKTAMDEMGKSLTEEQREFIARINAERKTIVTELDELKEEIRRPVTEYENREKERIARHEARLAEFIESTKQTAGMDSTALTFLMASIENFDTSGMDEFTGRAETEKGAALHRLGKLRDEIGAAEMKAAALEAERLAAEEKARLEREERIAAEAAEKARLAAEEEARVKAEAEAARVKWEQEEADRKREAERKAEADRIATIEAEKAAAELQAKEAAERAERERIATEERHRIALAEAETKARLEAEDKERQRLAKIEAERAAEEKRAANKRHQADCRTRAVSCLLAQGFETGTANQIITLIAEGKVEHVTINY
jgi:hypothetical protein